MISITDPTPKTPDHKTFQVGPIKGMVSPSGERFIANATIYNDWADLVSTHISAAPQFGDTEEDAILNVIANLQGDLYDLISQVNETIQTEFEELYCPECTSMDIDEVRQESSNMGEAHYTACNDCGYEWDHH